LALGVGRKEQFEVVERAVLSLRFLPGVVWKSGEFLIDVGKNDFD
jgi:hypothetical protein